MTPPPLTERYRHSRLQETFAEEIRERYGLDNAVVAITASTLTDLDNDGESDDLAGTGILQMPPTGITGFTEFKGFVFLLRESGESRFLDPDGTSFDPHADTRRFPCFASRAWLCDSPMDRARRAIRNPRITVREYDRATPGLELTIPRSGGLWAIVNSLQAFLN